VKNFSYVQHSIRNQVTRFYYPMQKHEGSILQSLNAIIEFRPYFLMCQCLYLCDRIRKVSVQDKANPIHLHNIIYNKQNKIPNFIYSV